MFKEPNVGKKDYSKVEIEVAELARIMEVEFEDLPFLMPYKSNIANLILTIGLAKQKQSNENDVLHYLRAYVWDLEQEESSDSARDSLNEVGNKIDELLEEKIRPWHKKK